MLPSTPAESVVPHPVLTCMANRPGVTEILTIVILYFYVANELMSVETKIYECCTFAMIFLRNTDPPKWTHSILGIFSLCPQKLNSLR